ncbi:MAG: ABC transporter permease subunit [Anaerolineales bacterium]|nr:ABC transporter permease subunit [Anaerolineales bacterium]
MKVSLPGKQSPFFKGEINSLSSKTWRIVKCRTKAFLNALQIAVGITLVILIWQGLALTVNKNIIPPPWETLRLFWVEMFSANILFATWQTFSKVVLALLFTMIVGILLGLLLGLSDSLYEICRPIIMLIQAVPVISWLSLVIFAWGIGWKGPVYIASISLLPISILTTVSGVRNLDKNLLEMARVYRVTRQKILKDIYIGTLMPFIVAILDVSIGQAWKVILVTEYLCGGKGLGVEILMARMNIDFPRVWAVTLIAVSLGIIMEKSVKFVLWKISRRWMFV